MFLTWILVAASVSAFAVATWLLIRGALYRPRRSELSLRVIYRCDHENGWFTLCLARERYLRWLPLPRYQAGQSISLSLPGTFDRRRYSLARWRVFPFRYEVTIKPEQDGKLSNQLASKARQGALLIVGLPTGIFVLPAEKKRRMVLIAGGVGITPMLAMMDQWSSGRTSVHELHLYWQTRSENEWIYRDVLEAHARRNPNIKLRLLASRAQQLSPEKISVELLKRDLHDLANTMFLLCAGQSLLDDLCEGLKLNGVAEEAIHFERFSLAAGTGDYSEWRVSVAGKQLLFSGQSSLLQVLEQGGVALPADCRTGTCGQCRVNVLAGNTQTLVTPEYTVRDDQVLACCSIPRSDLELSLHTA